MATTKPRFSITVSDDVYQAINEYQHENRFSTQTKAIQELISLGIESLSPSSPASADPHPFTVDPDIEHLSSLFFSLDDRDRGELIGYANGLLMQEKYKKARSEEQAG